MVSRIKSTLICQITLGKPCYVFNCNKAFENIPPVMYCFGEREDIKVKNLITAKMESKSSELKVGLTIKLDTAKNTHPSTPKKRN